MKNIEIKKSTVAQYRGLGKDVDFMADSYKITVKEMNDALESFGFKKARSKKVVEPTYTISYLNDIDTEVLEETNNLRLVEENA